MDFSLFGLVPMIFGGVPADTPRALLDSIYQPLVAGQYETIEEHYSDRLQELVAANIALNVRDTSGMPIDPDAAPIVEFNPFLNGYDTALEHLQVTEPIISDDTAVSLVSFDKAGSSTVLSVSMVREADAWKVDDIASVGEGEKWLYSWLLQFDPFSQQ